MKIQYYSVFIYSTFSGTQDYVLPWQALVILQHIYLLGLTHQLYGDMQHLGLEGGDSLVDRMKVRLFFSDCPARFR